MKYLRKFYESSISETDFEEFKNKFELFMKSFKRYVVWNPEYNLEMDSDGQIVYRGELLQINEDFLKFNSGPIKIDRVEGRVMIESDVESLEGCPTHVTGNFVCLRRDITSLIGCPKTIGGRFFFSSSQKLSSLEGGPEFVGEGYDVCVSNLNSLVGAPRVVYNNFNCSENDLTNLVGAPDEVGGDFMCNNNLKLTSLEGLTKLIEGDLYLSGCWNLWNPYGLRDCQVGGDIEFDEKVPFWGVSMIFPTMEDFINSLDYNYIKSPTKIDLFRFKEALDEIEIDYSRMSNVMGLHRRSIGKYTFVNEEGRRVDFDGKILKN